MGISVPFLEGTWSTGPEEARVECVGPREMTGKGLQLSLPQNQSHTVTGLQGPVALTCPPLHSSKWGLLEPGDSKIASFTQPSCASNSPLFLIFSYRFFTPVQMPPDSLALVCILPLGVRLATQLKPNLTNVWMYSVLTLPVSLPAATEVHGSIAVNGLIQYLHDSNIQQLWSFL